MATVTTKSLKKAILDISKGRKTLIDTGIDSSFRNDCKPSKMSFATASEKFLCPVIQQRQGIIPKHPIRLLNCVLISFKKDSIVFTVTDLAVALKIKIESYNKLPEDQDPSFVILYYDSLIELSKDIVGSKEVTLNTYDSHLEVQYGTSSYLILGIEIEGQFPDLEPPETELKQHSCTGDIFNVTEAFFPKDFFDTHSAGDSILSE